MVCKLLVWALAALICQAQSQQCNNCPKVGIPAPSPAPCSIRPPPAVYPNIYPQTILSPPPVISTTIVDNSVANNLANALQLLIVSDLIENKINPPVYASAYFPQPCDCVKSIGTVDIVSPGIDIAYTPIEIAPVNYGSVVDVSSSVVTEVIAPSVTNIGPTVYGGVTEYAPAPIGYSPSIIGIPEVSTGLYNPNIYAPVTDVFAPISPVTEVIAPVTSTVTTNVYGGITEVNPYGPELVSPYAQGPSVDVYTSITEVVNPVVSVAPTVSLNPYYAAPDMVPPFTPGYVTEITEIVGPREIMNPVPISPVYGGYTEVISPMPSGMPFAAEVIFPQSIPAQLKCNFGYGPCSVPQVNVETVPLVESFGGIPYYY